MTKISHNRLAILVLSEEQISHSDVCWPHDYRNRKYVLRCYQNPTYLRNKTCILVRRLESSHFGSKMEVHITENVHYPQLNMAFYQRIVLRLSRSQILPIKQTFSVLFKGFSYSNNSHSFLQICIVFFLSLWGWTL